LPNQERQVQPRKRNLWCRNAMMLDVGGNVFVMRMGSGQYRIVGMPGGIIPPHPFPGTVQLIAVAADRSTIQVEQFPHAERIAARECQLTFHFGSKGGRWCKRSAWKTRWRRIDRAGQRSGRSSPQRVGAHHASDVVIRWERRERDTPASVRRTSNSRSRRAIAYSRCRS
jgi:hypothetical protein